MIRDMPIKTIVRHHSYLLECLLHNAGRDVEEREPQYLVDENADLNIV